MTQRDFYPFEVSLSNDAYADKKISGAMIGTTKNEENRRIRKEYGFPSNRGIGFMGTLVTAEGLLNALLNGHVFCHLFNPTQRRKDGSFGSSQKKDDNFYGSYVIGVDIDHTNYPSVEAFVDKLELKPTFYYTSYSNMQVDENGVSKGARFRLIYVFDKLIQNTYFFRYLAWKLNKKIEKDTNEIIDDDCNLRCSQYFNGTNKDTEGIILSSGLTNYIYSFEDIDFSEDDFVDFLRHYCYYKTYNQIKVNNISTLLYNITNNNYVFNKTTTYYTECQNKDTLKTEVEYVIGEEISTVSECKCSENLVCDMQRLEYDEFMKYNRHKYPWVYRMEKEEWIDNTYQFINDDYFALYYNVRTVRDGQKRRKKLFERMCLRRVMFPSINADTLLFNAYEDVHRYFEVDKDLTIECLVKNVEIAMTLDIEDIKNKYSNNIAYLKNKRPKSGIIVRRGISTSTAERNKYLKQIRWSLISDFYDPSLSIKDNLEIIKENLFEISERTLYRYCKENQIKTDSNKVTDEELSKLLDVNLSVRKNLQILKDSNIKVGKDRVSKILHILINNKSNNISQNYFNNYTYSTTTTYYTECQNKDSMGYEDIEYDDDWDRLFEYYNTQNLNRREYAYN